MVYSNETVEKAALLHDIGKVLLRANPGRGTHEERGASFLAACLDTDTAEGAAILRAVGHHHQHALKELNPKEDDLCYIVYEADNMAAGTDRRETEQGGFGFRADTALANIFNVFSGAKKESFFRLRTLVEKGELSYPAEHTVLASPSSYQQIVETLGKSLQQKSFSQMTVQEVLQLLEQTMSYVPSSTATGEVPDISLYDHQKMTAAYAVCMYVYFQAYGITEYKTWCLGRKHEELRNTPLYLLVSGDISGIQDFIYTIPSKGALKSLRGRSFYLDFLLEHIVDEILAAVGMSRSCLLYTGGGHFYMLLPNTPDVVAVLQKASQQINDWFMQRLGNRLYLALGWTPCTANEFMDTKENCTAQAFRRVSQIVAKRKLQRYDEYQLTRLFSPRSEVNHVAAGTRECAVCHQSVPETQLAVYEDGEENACSFCRNLLHLGKGILDGEILAISSTPRELAVPLPGLDREWYAYTMQGRALESLRNMPHRLYVKNEMIVHADVATHLWVGDYTARDGAGHVLDFATLASYSGGSLDTTGIKRLGVMRADVDNLGAAFLNGFPAIYDTLSRKASLSRQLSFFFKRYITDICAGRIHGIDEKEGKKFSLFGTTKENQRFVHIIYSGGDDMFLVGAWDDLIELAVDIRRNFRRFTNNKLAFSAGIGFFNPSCPISEMARETGRLEDIAKNNPGKDSIMLFGTNTECPTYAYDGEDADEYQVYSWDRFIHSVCEEKLSFWQRHFQGMEKQDKRKLPIGKSSMYRLLFLLRDGVKWQAINLARFAYVLARMEPQEKDNLARMQCYDEVRTTFYEWYKKEEDRKELLTALQLVIYQLREREGDTNGK